jgi:hypothetical protein
MSHRDVGSRRLKLARALGDALATLPRLWIGAAGVLALLLAACLAPVLVEGLGAAGAGTTGAAVVLAVVAVGALARLSITPSLKAARDLGLGPLGLQFRWPELRLVGAALLCLIFLAMIVSVLGVIVLAIAGGAELNVEAIRARDWAAVGAPWRLAVVGAVVAGALIIPLVLTVRLSLFAHATLGRRQMVSLNSMGIAYGSFWALLLGLMIVNLPKIGLFTLIAGGVLGGVTASVVGAITLVAVQLPLTMAFLGAAYRQLEYWSPEEGSA